LSSSTNSPPTPLTAKKFGLRYLQPMPLSRTVGAPDFAGVNVSDFVEKCEATCRRYRRSPFEAELIHDLPSYCSPPILKEDLQILDGYSSENWVTLKGSLLDAFRSRDEKTRPIPCFNIRD
jgi:hypothetical protein